jgi:hypothetical protein
MDGVSPSAIFVKVAIMSTDLERLQRVLNGANMGVTQLSVISKLQLFSVVRTMLEASEELT